VTLRLLSYNIQHGGQDRLPIILDVIREQHPDLVALQEATSRPNAERLAEALGMQLVYGEANSPFAVAWLSRLPIHSSRNHRLPLLHKTLLEIEIDWEGLPLRLFATHLVAGRTEEHGDRRTAETRAILDTLAQAAGRPHLLVGDFNAVHPADRFDLPPDWQPAAYIERRPIQHILDDGYVDCFRRLHSDRPGYTHAAAHPWVRIDYVFASPELAGRVSGCGVAQGEAAARASDHFPVWAELS